MDQSTDHTPPTPKTPRGPTPRTDLLPRDIEALALVAAGFSNDQIAEHLGCTTGAVCAVVRRVFQRLGTTSRAHAVALGFRRGIIR